MSCQHKYKNSKSICKSPPLRDGFCTLHYKQKEKETRLKKINEENNNIVDDKNITDYAILDNELNLSKIQTTFRYNNLDILCIKINEHDIWFKAKEAAESMNYIDTDQAIRLHVFDEHKKYLGDLLKLIPVESTGIKKISHYDKKYIYISEAGLYCLMMSSKKPEAKAFKKYVTEIILPSIRKTGNYISNPSNIASSSGEIIIEENDIIYFYEINDITPYLNLNVIYFGDTGEVIIIDGKTYKVYKFGLSHRSIERDFREHKKSYIAFRMVHIKHCDNNIVIEQYLKMELKAKDLLYELPKKSSIGDKKLLKYKKPTDDDELDDDNNKPDEDGKKLSKNIETFLLTERYDVNYMIDLVNRLVEEYPLRSIKERDDKIKELECDIEIQKMNIELRMKEEDTKQKEEETKQKQKEEETKQKQIEKDIKLAEIQLEMMKLKYINHTIYVKNLDSPDNMDNINDYLDEINDDNGDESDDDNNNSDSDDVPHKTHLNHKNKSFLNNLKIDVDLLIKTIDVDDITPFENKIVTKNLTINDKYIIKRHYLKRLLKIDLTDDVVKIWYNKEKQLNNLLCAIGKKPFDDSEDPYFMNMNNKINYLNKILDTFGFKGPMDFEIVITSNDELFKKFEESRIIETESYKKMMNIFGKRVKNAKNDFDLNIFIRVCNSILNEFCIEIQSKKCKKTLNYKEKLFSYYYKYKLIHCYKYLDTILCKY